MALSRGAVARKPKILESRPLTRDDLAVLKGPRAPANRVQAFRDTHHRLARLVASGIRREEVVALSGYSYHRIAVLCSDPAFQELVASYRDVVNEAFERAQDQYATLATANMLKAEAMLSDKLDEAIESGETLPTRDLIAISRDAADRFGYGKKTFVAHANVGDQLQKAMVRSGRTITVDAKGAPPTIPASAPENASPQASPSPGSSFKALALGASKR